MNSKQLCLWKRVLTDLSPSDPPAEQPTSVRRRRRAWVALSSCVLAPLLWLFTVISVQAASLSIADGVVVKFDEQGGLRARDTLQLGDNVVFTSIHDDSVAGQTGQHPGIPAAGDWLGVKIEATVTVAQLMLNRLKIRYAGAEGHAALDLADRDYGFEYLTIVDSIVGVRSTGPGSPAFSGISLLRNLVGLESDFGSTPLIFDSEIADNSQFGILNLDPQSPVSALGNWWGDASGPLDPISNPSGAGNPVSEGVDYGQALDGVPLIDCSVTMASGIYSVGHPSVRLRLACRNAGFVRISEDPGFNDGNDSYFVMEDEINFLLDANSGPRRVYAQFMAATNNTVTVQTPQDIVYSPGAPSVTILAPAAGAVINTDTLIRAVASDSLGLQSVSFFVNDNPNPLATRETEPYEALWTLGSLPDGTYTLRARALNTAGTHTDAQINVTLQRQAPDLEGPVISQLRLAGQPLSLSDTNTVSNGGLLTFLLSDPSGIASTEVHLAVQTFPGGMSAGQYTVPLTFETVANGSHTLQIIAIDSLGNETVLELSLDVQIPPPAPPVLSQPVDGSIVAQPQITVSGSAAPGSTVKLYLNDFEVGTSFVTGGTGSFSASLTLPGLGDHAITADASNSRGTSARSAASEVTFEAGTPSVLITSPAQGAILSEDVEIAVQASDALGIARVELSIDGDLVATITDPPPYSWTWAVSGEPDGPRVIRAEATNLYGISQSVERTVTIEHPPAEPPPVVTPYTGIIDSVTPSISFGYQDIVIAGRAIISHDDPTPVPNAQVALILEIDGFQRRMNATSNAAGQFSFIFVPTVSDAGSYWVGARHPQEVQPDCDVKAKRPSKTLPFCEGGREFTINRLTVRPNITQLRAAYTVPTNVRIELRASAGSGANGVYLEPDGNLPPGVALEMPDAVTLLPGEQKFVDVEFLGGANAGSDGRITLEARSSDSGAAVRGTVHIDYQLSPPQPALRQFPNQVLAGAARGETVTGAFEIRNMGLAPAQGVQVQLRDFDGGINLPNWVSLSSSPTLGSIAVGESKSVQITATPHQNVAEGIYQFRVRVSDANTDGMDVLTTIAVSQGGVGGAKIHVSDIYTNPDEENGPIVPGLEGARVRLQSEVIPTNTHLATTNAEGNAIFENIPAGRYRYRVSGPSHLEAHGRIHIQPGISVEEEVFLDYNLVSFEWSVIETTILDHYEIVVEAIFQTQVPAPVVVIQPSVINLPPMQVGEEISGTMTISNYGLFRADNVEFTPPTSDQYFQYEFIGEVPAALEAKQRVTLQYKVTSLAPLPEAEDPGAVGIDLGKAITGKNTPSSTGGNCASYRRGVRLGYEYQCANGDIRQGSASSNYGRMYGVNCGSGSITHHHGPGCPGGCPPGTWGGQNGGPVFARPMFSSPGCMPDCESCECQEGGSGGGGSGSGGGNG